MLLSANDCELLQTFLIEHQLLGEPRKRIGGTFDFEAVDESIYDCDVYPRLRVREPKFIDNNGVRSTVKPPKFLAM